MIVRCGACGTDDIPETTDATFVNMDTTARDHLRIWHPDEWFSVEIVGGIAFLAPSEYVPPDTPDNPSGSDESTGRSE